MSAQKKLPQPAYQPAENPGEAAHLPLSRWIAGEIEAGSFPPGYRFAPTKELAQTWGLYPLAVHRALRLLADQGLVERQHRRGTFVRRSVSGLKTVVIYLSRDLITFKHLKFSCAVYEHLREILDSSGIRNHTFLDPRGDLEQTGRPCRDFSRLLHRCSDPSIIALMTDDLRMTWLSQLGRPLCSSGDIHWDWNQFARLGVESLKRQGCRTAGLILPFNPLMWRFARTFRDHARRAGIGSCKEWVKMPPEYIPEAYAEENGYRLFQALWKEPERPEGLLVFPDVMMPGVFAAMAQQRVRVPQDLKVVAHKNREVNFLCPYPIDVIVTSARDYAQQLLEVLSNKASGTRIPPPETTFRLEPMAPTC